MLPGPPRRRTRCWVSVDVHSCMWLCGFPGPLCWKRCPFPAARTWHTCWESVDHKCEVCFWTVCSVPRAVCLYGRGCHSPVGTSDVRKGASSSLGLPFQSRFGTRVPCISVGILGGPLHFRGDHRAGGQCRQPLPIAPSAGVEWIGTWRPRLSLAAAPTLRGDPALVGCLGPWRHGVA